MSEENKQVSRRFFELLNTVNLDELGSVVADDHVNHDAAIPQDTIGLDGLKQLLSAYLAAFPGLIFEIDQILAEGNLVCTRWTGSGINSGDLMGIPATNQQVRSSGITIARIEGGKIAESWVERDALGLMVQLGVVSLPG